MSELGMLRRGQDDLDEVVRHLRRMLECKKQDQQGMVTKWADESEYLQGAIAATEQAISVVRAVIRHRASERERR